MKKFNIYDYKGKYVMHCDTEKKAKIFCKYLDSIGKKWNDGESYLDYNCWDCYEEDTRYYFNDGVYGNFIYSILNDYRTLEFNDFDWSEQMFFKKLPNDFTGTLDVKNGMCEQPQILDDVEREYLSAVIKPFRDKIFVIIKGKSIDKECIHIVSKNYGNMFFPNFTKNTMYKGMELDKRYTLEELGL